MLLLFDGSCSLCRRASQRLVRWAAAESVERISFRDPGVLDRFPQVSAAACEQAMQLILPDGRVISGAEAAFRILATRWYFRPALWLYLIPGIRQLIDALYRLIARNRHRLGGGNNNAHSCDTGACGVGKLQCVPAANNDNPSKRIIDQRIRNLIIDYLELASSERFQREYQAAAPVNVANELFNQWDDYVNDRVMPLFGPPVYSPQELAAIHRYNDVWKAAIAATPDVMPPLDQFIGTQPWHQMRDAAESAFAIFQLRGRFDQEVEDARAEL